MADTIVFDLANANYYTNAGANLIDIPVVLKSTDPTINSFDFWFQFNTSELTYVSTTSLVSGLDAFSNFNQSLSGISLPLAVIGGLALAFIGIISFCSAKH